jgi:SAM-dependent methyltransferase
MSLFLGLRRVCAELRSVTTHAGKNLVLAIPGTRRLRQGLFGSAHWSGTYDHDWTARRTNQLRELLDAYNAAWGDFSWLGGKTSLEVGSGPDLAVPFTLLALGAGTSYASDVEACGSVELPGHAIASYRELASHYGGSASTRLGVEAIIAKVKVASPVDVGKLDQAFGRESIDLVVSTCALQHVTDPAAAIAQIRIVLRQGGRMIHTIAMGNHCCGDPAAEPLHHLVYPEWLWRAMFSQRVGHNRLRWFEWQEMIESSGFIVDHLRIAGRVDLEYVSRVRRRLAGRFRAMTPEQLAPAYVIVACTKAR